VLKPVCLQELINSITLSVMRPFFSFDYGFVENL
jgi:hypothetical protein